MLLHTQTGAFRKARSVNFTTNGFPSKVPTGTEPTTTDPGTASGSSPAFDLGPPGAPGGAAQNAALVMPYAVGNDNVTFSFRVYGWRVVGTDPATLLWVPCLLGEWACNASAFTGVAGLQVLNTERFADTITTTTAGGGDPPDVVSPTGDVAGHVLLDVKGFQKLEFTFTTGGSATSCNALFALI